MKNKSIILFVSLPFLLWSIACFVFFQYFYKYHLLHRLDMQLFLYSSNYLWGYFSHPAWLAGLLGDFLTQFFYFNFGGAFVLAFSILLLGILFYTVLGKLIPLPKKAKPIWFCIVRMILALGLMSWEMLRNSGVDYMLSSTVSLIGGMLLFLLYLCLPNRFRYISGVLAILLTYWGFGYGFWLLCLFMIIYELLRRKCLLPVLFLAVAVAFPLILRQSYHLTVRQAFLYPMSSLWETPDFKTEELLTLDILSYEGKWMSVASLSEKYDLSSGFSTYFYNLANGMMGQLPYKLMDCPQPANKALLISMTPTLAMMGIWSSNQAWFQVGDMTMAEHSAMLSMIFTPQHRSARMVMRLAEINIIKGDTTASLKYLRLLEKTWLYRKWALDRIPGKETPVVKNWIKNKQTLSEQTDTLRNTFNPQLSLRILVDSNRDNGLALDYLLCYDLLSKDINSFMSDYNKYLLPEKKQPVELYAAALLVGLSSKGIPSVDEMKRYLIPPTVFSRFCEYTNALQQGEAGKTTLINRFRQSYWFYYQFAQFKNK